MSRRHTTESFIERAIYVHGDLYDYSAFQYPDSNKVKAQIICKKHGLWMQRPNDHLSGYGCPSCGVIRTPTISWDTFITEARKVHGDRYSYKPRSLKYKKDMVTIYCKEHGEFTQSVTHHLIRKQGCRACCFSERDTTNYVSWKRDIWITRHIKSSTRIYVLECLGNGENFIKVGITGRSVRDRFRSASKNIPYEWKVICESVGDAKNVYDLEKKIQGSLRNHKYKPFLSFVGHTECFNINASGLVQSMIYGEMK